MGKSIYTKDEVIEMIHEYTKAERAVLTGKSYRIGTRELTRLNVDEIRKGRAYWENELAKINSKGRIKVRRGVPRNL